MGQQFLNKPTLPALKWPAVVFVMVAFLGFLDATYLTLKHYSGEIITCSITEGCGEVTSSKYATIGPIPVAILGAAYYLVIFLLSVLYLDLKKIKILKLAAGLTAIGMIASLYFIYLQAFVLNAYCQYCLGSALTSTILFVAGIVILVKLKKK